MNPDRLTTAAMTVAGLMLAHQVAAKAVRDSVFLTAFPPTDLPKVVIGAAAVSFLAVALFSRLLTWFGPRRVIPAGFIFSGVAHLVEWRFFGSAPWLAALIYLHISALGAILLSGFWSLASEVFDPYTAKQRYGRIAGAGTLGGILGGLAAERISVFFPQSTSLLLLAGLHVICSFGLLPMSWAAKQNSTSNDGNSPKVGRMELLKRFPHLGEVAIMVMLGTASAAVLDYLFKSTASSKLGKGPELLHFFAIFYTATQLLTFLVQTGLASRALAKLGLGRTVSTLPMSVGLGSVGGLLFPSLPIYTVARSLEYIFRGSLFRSGYELLFTPIAPAEKRVAKTFLDVACDRAGDAIGAGIVQLFLLGSATFLPSELLGVAVVMGAFATWIGGRLDSVYTGAVEQRLVDRAAELRLSGGDELGSRFTMVEDLQLSMLSSRQQPAVAPPAPTGPRPASPPPLQPSREPALDLLITLRSGDAKRVAEAIRGSARFDVVHVAQLLELLAWDDVAADARHALERCGERHTGMMIDALLDEETDFAIRRRVPRVLGRFSSQRTLDGLVAGLKDTRFEVRYQCSRAIDRMKQAHSHLLVDPHTVFAVVENELSVARPVWESRHLLDQLESTDAFQFLDDQLRDRSDRSLEHVFSLLAAVLPREPLKVSFRALHSEDHILRGLAMEYMDSILPENLRERMRTMIKTTPEPASHVTPEEALQRLLDSHASLMMPSQTQLRPSVSGAAGQSGQPPQSTQPKESH